MLLSVISVTYNCEKLVKKTICSLLSQSYQEYEYIVIDGKSTDNTVKEIKKYESKFQDFFILSEPDNGIYDAMNKGAAKAKGNYLYFLNMGDFFYNEHVLMKMSKVLMGGKQIYYGNMLIENKMECYPDKLNDFFFLRERMICHQAIFAKRCLFDKEKFDLDFPVCADRDWMIRQLKNGESYEHANITIGVYDQHGISSNYKIYAEDSIRIIEKYYSRAGIGFVKIKRRCGKILKYILNRKKNKK